MKITQYLTATIFSLLLLSGCQQDGSSTQSSIDATLEQNEQVVARVGETDITYAMLLDGIENDIYDAENKIYELKKANLRDVMLKEIIASELKEKNLTQKEYIDKFIANDIVVNDQDIIAFAKERNVPEDKIDASLKQQIRDFLFYEKRLTAIDEFTKTKAGEKGVEIFLEPPAKPIIIAELNNRPTKGPENAKVTIIEYSDFECPFCKRGAKTIEQLLANYNEDVRVIFKNFPLAMHPNARRAAEAGMCAFKQSNDAFWKLHDKMFEMQKQLSQKDLLNYGEQIGLEMEAFTQCVEARETKLLVEIDMKDAAKAKLRSTPTFIVNGERIDGLPSLEDFSKTIEKAIKAAEDI